LRVRHHRRDRPAPLNHGEQCGMPSPTLTASSPAGALPRSIALHETVSLWSASTSRTMCKEATASAGSVVRCSARVIRAVEPHGPAVPLGCQCGVPRRPGSRSVDEVAEGLDGAARLGVVGRQRPPRQKECHPGNGPPAWSTCCRAARNRARDSATVLGSYSWMVAAGSPASHSLTDQQNG
jgi:hypothetical protein